MFDRIVSIGVKPGMEFHDARKIRLLNSMALVGLFSFFFLFIFNIVKGAPLVFFITNASGQIILFTTLLLNYFGQYKTARWFCVLFIWLFFNSLAFLLGEKAGIEYLNILICITPLIFFDRLRDVIFLASLSLIGFLASKFSFVSLEPVFDNPHIAVIYTINMVILFLSSFLLLFFYRGEINRYAGLVEVKNGELAEKNKEITDSINYAKRIQNTLLRYDREIERLLPESFIFFQPRDVVGGDFFWFHKEENKIYGACADCTGHGIPGAFMSMIGITLLNDIVVDKGIKYPNLILDELNQSIIRMFRQRETDQRQMRDGMEISLVVLDTQCNTIEFSLANSNLFILRNGNVIEKKGDAQPIGWHIGESQPFTLYKEQLQKNDCFYLFTDGLTDQFGGAANKKFLLSRFREFLKSVSDLPTVEQKSRLISVFESWKGDNDQIDDVCVIGVRV